MIKFLMVLFAINLLSAADKEDELQIVSPQRCLTPERGCILKEHFALVFRRPDFATALASTYADPKVMKYLASGGTLTESQVRDRFYQNAISSFNDQDLKSYYWAVITRSDGVCGVITAFATKVNGVLETSTLLTLAVQGKRLSKHLREAVFEYLPTKSWVATADPRNVASWKSQESVGFIFQKTEYVEAYNAFRKYYSRQSNDELENREVIRFTYSGKSVRLDDLLSEIEG